MPMLMFIIFLIAIIFFLLGLGYGLSWIEERSTRRYRTAQEAAVKEEHPEAKV